MTNKPVSKDATNDLRTGWLIGLRCCESCQAVEDFAVETHVDALTVYGGPSPGSNI